MEGNRKSAQDANVTIDSKIVRKLHEILTSQSNERQS